MKRKCISFVLCCVFIIPVSLLYSDQSLTGPFLVLQSEEQTPVPAAEPPKDESAEETKDLEPYDVNYTYDPGVRRDPFISLLAGIRGGPKSKLPPGALTVSDARVVGITRNRDGFVAVLMGTDNKARFMKVGDKLYDGAIIAIESDKVVFRQDLSEDITVAPGLKSKEVIKRLHPVQEGT